MSDNSLLAWTAIRGGHPVVDTAGEEWGHVTEVLADRDDDIFHGVAVRTGRPSTVRELPAAEIVRITDAAVTTRIAADSIDGLPEYAGTVHATIELEPNPDGPVPTSNPDR